MVGRQNLDLIIEVRILGGEPATIKGIDMKIGSNKKVKEINDGKKEFEISFCTIVGKGEDHDHPHCEITIRAKDLKEAIDIVKRGSMEIQSIDQYGASSLKENNFTEQDFQMLDMSIFDDSSNIFSSLKEFIKNLFRK